MPQWHQNTLLDRQVAMIGNSIADVKDAMQNQRWMRGITGALAIQVILEYLDKKDCTPSTFGKYTLSHPLALDLG